MVESDTYRGAIQNKWGTIEFLLLKYNGIRMKLG